MATEAVVDQHIAVLPGVAGGKPRIAGHRLTVQNIVIWHEWMSLSAEEIATEHGIGLADVYAALTYYYDHRDEIDQSIQADEAFIQQVRQMSPSKLPEKLRGK